MRMCHEPFRVFVRSEDYVEVMKANILRTGPLITWTDLAPFQARRQAEAEASCECNDPEARLATIEALRRRAGPRADR
jgi:hypothetical protein